jgi:hypothetical protein
MPHIRRQATWSVTFAMNASFPSSSTIDHWGFFSGLAAAIELSESLGISFAATESLCYKLL